MLKQIDDINVKMLDFNIFDIMKNKSNKEEGIISA